ncbi:LOW QUALITY PROTEIN: hypothetical protein U9M48_000299 [Paspalum notatum var. saurae]|uniref:Reverse transcriptase n=1 Tax=Paspalum notatum var. saurae TaxID=547442 RepID=A0AAQ3PGN2_PASNO
MRMEAGRQPAAGGHAVRAGGRWRGAGRPMGAASCTHTRTEAGRQPAAGGHTVRAGGMPVCTRRRTGGARWSLEDGDEGGVCTYRRKVTAKNLATSLPGCLVVYRSMAGNLTPPPVLAEGMRRGVVGRAPARNVLLIASGGDGDRTGTRLNNKGGGGKHGAALQRRRRQPVADMEVPQQAPPLPPAVRADDHRGSEEQERQRECSVCLSEMMADGGEAALRVVRPCGHRFHATCVDQWLRRRGTCPMCRAPSRAQEADAADRRRRRDSAAGGDTNDGRGVALPPPRLQQPPAPATVAVEMVRSMGPLVCTYRRADGWPEAACAVCLAELDDGVAVRVLPVCMHYFHADCVGEWLRAHHTCPLCRAPLEPPDAAAQQQQPPAPAPTAPARLTTVEMAMRRSAEPIVCTYRKADGWSEATCAVCLAELADGVTVRVLPVCVHYFHASCIGEWLLAHHTCPLCRAPLHPPQRRQAGLCYNCDEKFVPGHRCKRIFVLEVVPDDDDDQAINALELQADPDISIHALTGIRARGQQAMKLLLVALIDSGSTCCFVDSVVAAKLGLALHQQPGLHVTVGNGDQITSPGLFPNLFISVGSEKFVADFYALPLGTYDVVLGVNWLGSLGPILWDFNHHTMAFQRANRRITWIGIDAPRPFELRATTLHDGELMTALLDEFTDVFQEPQGLPPQRAISHRIRLSADTKAVAVRPYRYAHVQKEELEKQCAELLRLGIIRPSSLAFSAPTQLVRKKEGAWRLCIDYRALNTKTIKDKFPIPVVEELLDELRGAKFFTKLDLRSGYHQVLMDPADIHKTAFRTHQGLFEFLVMPFGLSNASATFQALMNTVLGPFLRKFVLVFFDDILIYSSSWVEHLRHVRAVLQTLQVHKLFLKRSKCVFGMKSVGYLGHVISAAGVTMDAQKVQAILQWPTPRNTRALRGFLGLAGYYRRFILNFDVIAEPLTRLLRKEGFSWLPEAEAAFRKLQQALTTAPVLQLPDFDQEFVVECDTSGSGFGAVLHQGQGAVAFFSQQIAPRHAKLAAYERELIGLAHAVRHWRPYLWGREFLVKTDHRSLKFLLDQRLSTVPQHHWISKLLGFDFKRNTDPAQLTSLQMRCPDATQLKWLPIQRWMCRKPKLQQEQKGGVEWMATFSIRAESSYRLHLR